MDRELGDNDSNVAGPITRRLEEFGQVIPLVFGGFREVSEEVNNLIDTMAKYRLDKESMMSGSQFKEKKGSDCWTAQEKIESVHCQSQYYLFTGQT